ncbi:unnamed protein product [Rhizophagus irregularis]|uniref:Uncharacterized protein n=1 Tax=Rhizophagus irregularis TaxID=588596 RepID=A0A2N1N619_9GLOM|nr:hypothetical protein RhiirC2_748650 [Rhizophagus irregularis]CAB4388456.1 unnamed protein product [Rhizophagus irregularis]CAB5381600.1 unnamed protein product [Rhizophagus irregularis]
MFTEVNSVAINNKRDNFCDGFEITLPSGSTPAKNSTKITVNWKKGDSEIVKINDVELFNDKGLLNVLWEGEKSFNPDGTATQIVEIAAPDDLKLPAEVLLRSWGSTANGPNCFKITPFFTLNAN